MAKSNSTVLPLEVGLEYRRLYCTIVASVTVMTEIQEALKKPDVNKSHVDVLADCLGILMSRVETHLDFIGVPKDWRGS